MRHLPSFSLSALYLAFACTAQAQPLIWDEAQRLELKNLAANVFVVPEARTDIDIKVRYGKVKTPTLLVSKRGDTVVLNGQMPTVGVRGGFNMILRITDDEGHSSGQITLPGAGLVNIKDLPVVFVRVPLDAHIQDNALVFGQITPSQNLELTSCGRGQWDIATVAKTLNIIECGASEIRVQSASNGLITATGTGAIIIEDLGNLKANLTGSGRLDVRRAKTLELQNQGSGDVDLGQVGPANIKLGGSGDLFIKTVTGKVSVVNNGAADIDIRQLEGTLSLDMAGSGDVNIQKGAASDIAIRSYGSGDVYFGGQSHTVTIDSFGSGDVKILRATGSVITRVRGSGDMDIGR